MQTCYVEYFGHTCTCPPKAIISTCRKLWSLSICKKWTWSLTTFLRYYAFNISAIWLAESVWLIAWKPEFFQTRGLWWNINNKMIFHSRLFPGKTNDKIFQKIRKIRFLTHFTHFWTKLNFLKIVFLPVFIFFIFFWLSIILPNFKNT